MESLLSVAEPDILTVAHCQVIRCLIARAISLDATCVSGLEISHSVPIVLTQSGTGGFRLARGLETEALNHRHAGEAVLAEKERRVSQRSVKFARGATYGCSIWVAPSGQQGLRVFPGQGPFQFPNPPGKSASDHDRSR